MKLFRLIPFSAGIASIVSLAALLNTHAADTHGDSKAHNGHGEHGNHELLPADVQKEHETLEPRRFLSTEQEWASQFKEAQRLERAGKDEQVESILYALKSPPYPEKLKKDIYPHLIKFYEKRKMRVKLIEIYEEFAERYPNDHELPVVYFKLGNLYREFGAFTRAQDRYYKVLSTTIRGVRTEEEKQEFRQTSLKAQIEVADLFLELGNYERAAQFFDRLLRLEDLDPSGSTTNRAKAEFKRAFATYYSVKDLKGDDILKRNEGFAQVIRYLLHAGPDAVPFYDAYPENVHAPESHFLLASMYRLLGTQADKDKAHDQVLLLLEKANKGVRAKTAKVTDFDDKETEYKWNEQDLVWEDDLGDPASVDALMEIRKQIDQWVHWQKKAGNFLANELFEEGDTNKAVGIYQRMILLDPTPLWQAPIVYQLGLCFERIGGNSYNPKAIEAYEIITNNDKNPASWNNWTNKVKSKLDNKGEDIDNNLEEVLQGQEQFIYRMAQWRLKNLRWNLSAESEVKRLEN